MQVRLWAAAVAEAEVGEIRGSVRFDQDVLRRDPAVNETRRVSGSKRFGKRPHCSRRKGEPLLLQVTEPCAAHVPGGDEASAPPLAAVINRDEVRVMYRGKPALLIVEAVAMIGRHQLVRGDQAKSDGTAERRLRRFVDDAERPRPDRPFDPKRPDRRARRDDGAV
jgi:hypothetical protein